MEKTSKFILFSAIIALCLFGSSILAQDTSNETATSNEATTSEANIPPMEEVAYDENVEPEDLEVGDPKVLPDNPFYFIKDGIRGIRMFFAFNPTAKAELREKFANERLIELKKLIRNNKNPKLIRKALEKYQGEIDSIKELADRIKEKAKDNKRVDSFLDKFTKHQILHHKILQKLESQVPPEVFERIKQAREKHLERFKDVMLKLEDKDKIPERLEKQLERLKGSKFKEFKNLEILDALKDKLPEEIKEKIEAKKEILLERLREKLETLSPEDQKKFKQYIENLSGDRLRHLNIISGLEGKELSPKLKKIIETVREKKIEGIERYALVENPKEAAEKQIKEAEKLLEELKSLISEKEINKEEMPAVFRLLDEAEEKLTAAKNSFDEENYGRAYGQATASIVLSRNAIRIIKIRLGFKDSENGESVCSDINFPVCGEDGKTYKNICEAKKAGVKIAYRTRCREENEIECAKEGERVNRSPLLGPTDQVCCEGLKEIKINRIYSICVKPDASFECETDEDCPLSSCPGVKSRCVAGICKIPSCSRPSVCIQVITPAKNPTTGECKEFPTPCDVPTGWVKVNSCSTSTLQIPIKIPPLLEKGPSLKPELAPEANL